MVLGKVVVAAPSKHSLFARSLGHSLLLPTGTSVFCMCQIECRVERSSAVYSEL